MLLLSNPFQSIDAIKSYLKSGKIICFPTETVYALSCDAQIADAIQRIYNIKQRTPAAPFSILVKDIEQMQKYVTLNEFALKLIKKFSPGPITYILPALPNAKLPSTLCSKNVIGVRIPDHPISMFILNKYKRPLVATSVNLSKKKPIINTDEILKYFPNIDMVVANSSENNISGISSTVIDLSTQGKYSILREGSITQKQIDLALRDG